MKFFCGACKTKYQISDAKVRGKILTIRCQKCSAKIVVRETAVETATVEPVQKQAAEKVEVTVKDKIALAAGRARSSFAQVSVADLGMPESEEDPTTIAPDPRQELAGIEWYSAHNGIQDGPFELKEIIRRIGSGQIEPSHYVWHQHMGPWTRVREVAELASYIPAPTAPTQPPPMPAQPPPVPVDRGAEVVDFASKLAERDRTKRVEQSSIKPRTSKPEVKADDKWSAKTDVSVSARKEPKEPPTPDSKSLPQLPAANAIAAALGAESVLQPVVEHEAFDDFAGKEDIFANIPRIEPEPTRIKESTRFFVAAAGIQQRHKRNKMGMMAGISVAAVFVLFLGSWAVGLININFERIGDVFKFRTREAPEEYVDDNSLDEDESDIADKLDPKKPKIRRPRPKSAANDDPRSTSASRGHDTPKSIALGDDQVNAAAMEIPQARLPEARPGDLQVPVDTTAIDAKAIENVVNSRKPSIKICYQQSLKGEQKIRGRLELAVLVRPTGDVAKVSVVRSVPGAGALADCIADKMKEWRFPAFAGKEPTEVRVPFILEQQF